jgi:hypothetical protein
MKHHRHYTAGAKLLITFLSSKKISYLINNLFSETIYEKNRNFNLVLATVIVVLTLPFCFQKKNIFIVDPRSRRKQSRSI